MAKLTNCIECDGRISNEAKECPHCKTKYPRGVRCLFCEQVMKQPEARSAGFESWAHHSCHETMKSDTIGCPACHTRINGPRIEKCPKCGHPFRIEICHYCYLPVYTQKAKEWETYSSLHSDDTDTVYAHPLCYSLHNKKCFIASAVCDPFAQELLILRFFRYYYLEQSQLGDLFLRVYMKLSPHIAKIIIKSSLLSLLVRNLFIKPTAKIIAWLFGGTILPWGRNRL